MARPKNKKPSLPENKLPNNNDMTMDNLAKEGEALLSQTPTPQIKPIEEVAKDNPYIIARTELLEKRYPTWRKAEILKMERENNTNNRFYEDYVKDCLDLGNYYFNKQEEKKSSPQQEKAAPDLGE